MSVVVSAVLALGSASCQRHTPPPPTPVAAEPPLPEGSEASMSVGVRACDDYLRRVAACASLPRAARDTIARGAIAWRRAAGAPQGSAKVLADACDETARLATPELERLGC
jgi:hypothetical protein